MRIVLAIESGDLRLATQLLLDEEPGVTIVGTVTDWESLLALLPTTLPDLVLVDSVLYPQPSPKALQEVGLLAPAARVIVLGSSAEQRELSLNAGADAFVLKGDPPSQLLAAVRQTRPRPGAPGNEVSTETEGE